MAGPRNPKATTGVEGTPKMPATGEGGAQGVLHQRSKMPFCPARMAVAGVAVVVTIGYFTLYSHKKPEASAIDVARVTSGTSNPEHTHPRK